MRGPSWSTDTHAESSRIPGFRRWSITLRLSSRESEMPRLRPPTTAKKEELFDSTIPPPEADEQEKPTIIEAAPAPEQPFQQEETPKVEEPKQDEAAIALQRQIDDIRRNEEAQRLQLQQQREEALRLAQENAKKYGRSERDRLDAERTALESSLATAKALSDKALLDYENAENSGDAKAKAEALDRMTDAKADMRVYQRGIEELKEKRRDLKKERRKLEKQAEGGAVAPEQQRQATVDDMIDRWQLPPAEDRWAREHREYMEDPDMLSLIGGITRRLGKQGIRPGDTDFIPRLEAGIEFFESGGQVKQESQKRTSIVSAHVSREVPSASGTRTSGKITLTAEQREAARLSGITEAEYARQLSKFNQMKANGEYGERR